MPDDIVADARTAAITFARLEFAHWIEFAIDPPPDWIESPLEHVFWIWVSALSELPGGVSHIPSHVRQPQWDIETPDGRFRADAAFWPRIGDLGTDACIAAGKPLLIELDGHGFHERTQEQVIARDQKDAALQRAGYTVLHYSYARFMGDPVACVRELFAALEARR